MALASASKISRSQNRLGARAKGNGLLQIRQVQRNGVGQRLLHFSNGAEQRFLETGAAILLQRFFRDDQREQFALGDLQRGKGADFLGVMIAETAPVEFQRQLQPVAHELEVAMDGFGADLQLARQAWWHWETCRTESPDECAASAPAAGARPGDAGSSFGADFMDPRH